jgi:acyl dehydratase
MLMFEDFKPGHFMTLGPRHVTREEIIAFASEFDPQPMHLDDDAADRSLLRGLSGSGWHMCALAMRMQVDGFLLNSASLSGLGVPECRWLSPLRPDDQITLEVFIEDKRLSKNRPGTGIVNLRTEMFNAKRVTLMMMSTNVLFGCRDQAS